MEDREFIDILKKSGCSQGVINHILAVKELSLKIADRVKIPVDRELVRTGAFLHDIGRSRTHGIEHAVVGAEMARKMGFDDRVIRIIERHIGAGISREEARELGLPEKDYLPQSPEEKIIAYADNLLNGDRVVPFEVSLEQFKQTLGSDHPAIERYIALHREIQEWMNNET
ncbi:MAG TPA: TIGR00295 family protein [Nitrospirae bacterium]|nr:TIGR00295 family protein [Nitrospirota bacterium]